MMNKINSDGVFFQNSAISKLVFKHERDLEIHLVSTTADHSYLGYLLCEKILSLNFGHLDECIYDVEDMHSLSSLFIFAVNVNSDGANWLITFDMPEIFEITCKQCYVSYQDQT